MRKIAKARIVGLLVAIVCIGASIYFALEATRMNAEFHEWLSARPMEVAFDLSRVGETTVLFHQTCSISHGEALYLECDLDENEQQNPEDLFKDLSGRIVIRDSDGNEIESVKMNSKTAQFSDGQIILTEFQPFRNGEYVATIAVDSGVPAFADKRQTLYARYQLCGLEKMPSMVTGVFSFVAGFIGLISVACVLPGLLQFGIRHEVPVEIA